MQRIDVALNSATSFAWSTFGTGHICAIPGQWERYNVDACVDMNQW